MAMPQYAMAHPGSVWGMAVKALIVSGKKNECSMPRARSNCFCASGEHDVLKRTRPSFSGFFFAAGSTSAQADVTSARAANRIVRQLVTVVMELLRRVG